MLCEAISNTRESILSDIQTLRSWLKKNLAAPCFVNSLLSVWISDETLILVFDISHPYNLIGFSSAYPMDSDLSPDITLQALNWDLVYTQAFRMFWS